MEKLSADQNKNTRTEVRVFSDKPTLICLVAPTGFEPALPP